MCWSCFESDASSCVLLTAARYVNCVFNSSHIQTSSIRFFVRLSQTSTCPRRVSYQTCYEPMILLSNPLNICYNQRPLSVFRCLRSLNCWILRLNYPGETCFHLVMIFRSSKPRAILFFSLASSMYAWYRHVSALNIPSSKLGLESLMSLELPLSWCSAWPWQYALIKYEFEDGYPL